MRVTHIITRLIIGGAQENTLATVHGLRQKPGFQVNLISGPSIGPEGSLEGEAAKIPGLLTVVPELVRPIHPLKDFIALRRLEKILHEQKPDLVHTHSGKAGVLGRLAAHRAGVPVIIHTIHGPSFGAFQGSAANFVFKAAERVASKWTTHFVTVAHAMTEQYLAAGIGRPEQYTRIFSGFPLEPFLSAKNDRDLRAQLNLAPEDFVVGKIARLFTLKGHDDLLDIAPKLVKECPRMKFLFVGDGLWRERLQNRAREAGLEKFFIFTGLVPPAEVSRYVGIMDALVHLSRREGLPRALPQALAAARPVIAYDCDGAREICIENETGFLIPAGDLNALGQRLLQLSQAPELCKRLGKTGQVFVKNNFSTEGMVDKIHDLYLSLGKK